MVKHSGKFRLKTGFFKTELYDLHICDCEIVLEPTEGLIKRKITIKNNDISSINIYSRSINTIYIEIYCKQDTFMGDLLNDSNSKELLEIFKRKFNSELF